MTLNSARTGEDGWSVHNRRRPAKSSEEAIHLCCMHRYVIRLKYAIEHIAVDDDDRRAEADQVTACTPRKGDLLLQTLKRLGWLLRTGLEQEQWPSTNISCWSGLVAGCKTDLDGFLKACCSPDLCFLSSLGKRGDKTLLQDDYVHAM